jgi:dihydrofolate reductase
MLNGKIIKIAFASAYTENGRLLIGKDNDLPGWQGLVPSDMSRFVRLTSYHSVISGRKTWDSLPINFRPLKNRQNIILTRDVLFNPEFDHAKIAISNTEVAVAHSLEEALALAKSEVVWIIGGAKVYALALPYVDYIHWTKILGKFDGDTFFPPFDNNEWQKIEEEHCTVGVSGTKKSKDQLDSDYYVFQKIC